MKRPVVRRRVPVLAQDALLGLFVAFTQVQANAVKPLELGARPFSDFGYLGYGLLAASGLVLIARRVWPAAVFITTALLSVTYKFI